MATTIMRTSVKASHVKMMSSIMKLMMMSWGIVVALLTLNDFSRPLLPSAVAFQIAFPSRPLLVQHHRHHHHPQQQNSFTTIFMVSPLRSSSGGGGGGDRAARLRREADIRRKISQLKQEGKLKKQQGQNDDDDDDDDEMRSVYEDKIRQKLGAKKSKLLGYSGSSRTDDDDDDDDDDRSTGKAEKTAAGVMDSKPRRQGQLGTLPQMQQEEDEELGYSRPIDDNDEEDRRRIIDPSLFEDSDDDSDSSLASTVETEEEELVDMVARKMMEKRYQKERDERERLQAQARAALDAKEKERQAAAAAATPLSPQTAPTTATTVKQTTSGVGGSWGGKDTNETSDDLYKPKTGSWGAFPRPRDISKAYGGGRRVGVGYSNEEEEARAKSAEDTREKLRQYREKVGIDVQSEKDHAAEIDEAIKIAGLAMQRGIYATAVSALEKVTKYCSSNSKIGGKVFLELAMAYEAVGRTQEAIKVYTTLSRCRIEEIKHDAKRLLYGIESFQFMKNEVGSKEFSRKKAKTTFIETTGLSNIASYFDDVYQTAYIDLDGGFYKKLTESVVRSSREARQVLLQATGAGEVRRQRIVQALRSLSRHFDDALQQEIEMNTVQEDVAVMDGKPIMERRPDEKSRSSSSNPGFSSSSSNFDDFVLSDAAQMLENLNGDWRLQLLADKSGDGVKFFNNTEAWQILDTQTKKFSSLTPSGFLNVQQSGSFEFNDEKRILAKQSVQVSSAGVFGGLLGGMGLVKGGAPGVVNTPRQVISVDSILLVTRGVPIKKKPSETNRNDDKDYFAVWRRVEPGTFSSRR